MTIGERLPLVQRPPKLCWIDLETTGLDPAHDRILQAAAVITDTDLTPLADPFEVTVHRGAATLGLMNSHVREMHERTGLLARVEASRTAPEAAYSQLYAYVRDLTRDAYQVTLAGSSVHFDRRFIEHYIPRLNALFHHRLFDVSAFKYAAAFWGYPAYQKRGVVHLAPDDIQNSIGEIRHYRKHMLREL